jgi:hypothetical protein
MKVKGEEDKITKKFIKEFLTERRDALIDKREEAHNDMNGELCGKDEYKKPETDSLTKVLFESDSTLRGYGFEDEDMGTVINEFRKLVNGGFNPMSAATELSDEYPMSPSKILFVAAGKGIIDEHWGDLYKDRDKEGENGLIVEGDKKPFDSSKTLKEYFGSGQHEDGEYQEPVDGELDYRNDSGDYPDCFELHTIQVSRNNFDRAHQLITNTIDVGYADCLFGFDNRDELMDAANILEREGIDFEIVDD